ncbi:hypothetical protein [Streptomyces sp. NPDC003077]|uniref:hypothetical protein n=1 Tax=Streptomyces sp. NPDC003077 TaxID=3154443 RepID=UPI0033A5AF98
MVLAGAWHAGALHRPRPTRLLKAIGEAGGDGPGLPGKRSEFEQIVLYGVAEVPDGEYPPPGHGYPGP